MADKRAGKSATKKVLGLGFPVHAVDAGARATQRLGADLLRRYKADQQRGGGQDDAMNS